MTLCIMYSVNAISHDWNGPQKSKKNSLIAQCGTCIIIIIQKLETLEINNVVFSLSLCMVINPILISPAMIVQCYVDQICIIYETIHLLLI